MSDLEPKLHYPATCEESWRWESVGGKPVITRVKQNMEWIYDQVASVSNLSYDWAVLLVQFTIVLGSLLLLVFLIPSKFSMWFERRFFERKVEYVHWRLSNGYVHYWHQWGTMGLSKKQIERQKKLLDAGVDYILEICMKHNLERLVKNELLDFDFADIKRVVAAWAGYVHEVRVGELYRWIIELHNGQYRYIRGWYDPSRYKQRTSLFSWSAETVEEAALFEIQSEVLARKGHKKSKANVVMDQDVYQSFLAQIRNGDRDLSGFRLEEAIRYS
jgi:hypothetical protein